MIWFAPAALLAGLGVRAAFAHHQDNERSHLIASIVREEASALARIEDLEGRVRAEPGWPNDYLQLESWLIRQVFSGVSPAEISSRLGSLSAPHSYSSGMRRSLERWTYALDRWAAGGVGSEVGLTRWRAPPELVLGRTLHVEAEGYHSIGRDYDAAVLDLWTARALIAFVEKDPGAPEAPEALYLLGEGIFRLRHALNGSVRADRVLNLCSEFYPDSIWARQATSLWRSEIGHGLESGI
jgi:hypothetical protein